MQGDPATLTAALEHAPSGIAVLGDHGRIEWVNRRMGRMLRRDRDELAGMNLAELMHPDDVVPEELEVGELEAGRIRDCGRKRFVRPDGTPVWTGLTLSPFSDVDGAPGSPAGSTRLVANVFDLTELVLAEGRLASVVAGLDDAVVSIDQDGRIAVANPAAQRLLGFTGVPLVGLDLADVPWEVIDEAGEPLAPTDRPELVALASGQPAFATTGLRDGDETRWVEVAAHPLVRSGQRSVAATYKDVSERLRIEAALKQAEAADRAKSEFLSRMSHELRTPLNSVLGFAQLLQIDELTSGQQEAVDQILRAGRHLLGLLDEVLDLERMQSGRLDVRLQPVAATAVLQEAVELVQPLAVASGIAVDLRVGREGAIRVLADEQRLRQVLLNLLTNGVKFNRPHGRVSVSCHVLHDTMVIRVRDTGYGIAPADLGQIFMPFERLDADRRGIEGAGVGLALAKRLTEAMGGAIEVESEPGRGSTFFLVLRTTNPETEVVDAPPPVSPELLTELLRSTDPTRRRVLYIEDNAESRALMERIAEMHGGLDLTTAPTAGEGLERARTTSPDAILLDLHLPDGSGDEVMESLKRDPATRDTPVIILTADATPQRRGRLTASGAVAYLTKPVDLSELFAALEVALGPASVTLVPIADDPGTLTQLGRGEWRERPMNDGGTPVRALVVEDDEGNRLLLSRYLAQEGYEVLAVADGPSAVREVTADPPDVVILDLGLPGIDGIDVLRRIRRDSGVPVLVLTGRDDESAKLTGFEVGADDYVVKPFSLAEINARLRALMRRGIPIAPRDCLDFDHLVIDLGAATATLAGAPLELRPKEFALLAFMASDPGRCFSREELLEHVWGSTEGWQQAATVTEHVHRLRTRLSVDPGHDWIETVRGMGYRFVAG